MIELAEQLMERLRVRHRLPGKSITAAGRSLLRAYTWPGNVRELSHELERAIVYEEGHTLDISGLSGGGGGGANLPPDPHDWLIPQFAWPSEGFALEEAINRLIQLALKQTGNNVSGAARLLGVSRDYVRYRLSGGKSSDQPGE
jgi:DNA-binding NtrC family response regulator